MTLLAEQNKNYEETDRLYDESFLTFDEHLRRFLGSIEVAKNRYIDYMAHQITAVFEKPFEKEYLYMRLQRVLAATASSCYVIQHYLLFAEDDSARFEVIAAVQSLKELYTGTKIK